MVFSVYCVGMNTPFVAQEYIEVSVSWACALARLGSCMCAHHACTTHNTHTHVPPDQHQLC